MEIFHYPSHQQNAFSDLLFFLIESGSSLLIRWSFNTVYQLQERVILYSSYFHSEGRLFNLYCVQNLLPVIFLVFYLFFYHIYFSSYLTSNNKNKIQRGAFSVVIIWFTRWVDLQSG